MKEHTHSTDFFLKLFFLTVVIKLMHIRARIYVFDNESYIAPPNPKDI